MIVHNVEQNSPEWDLLRSGIPTASEFKMLVSGTGKPSTQLKKYAHQLAADKFAGRPLDRFDGTAHTERGHALEAEAADEYGLIHDCEPVLVGFVTDDLQRYGCSPDRLINETGLLEIKCLKADRHIEAMMYHENHGDIQPDYRTQVQGQMMVCERQWCDSLFYHPSLPSFTHRSKPDESFFAALQKQITEVLMLRDETIAFLQEKAA